MTNPPPKRLFLGLPPCTFHSKKEGFFKLQDLLPEGVKKVDDLKVLYEGKQSQKKKSHLDCFSKAHQGAIKYVMFSPNYNFIISSSDDGSIKFFDAETYKDVYHIERAHEGSLKALAITSNCQCLVFASQRAIKIFKFNSGSKKFQLDRTFPSDPITSMVIRKDKEVLFTTGAENNNSLNLFNLESSGPTVQPICNFDEKIQSIKMISDRLVALLTEDGSIFILDLLYVQEYCTFKARYFGKITSIAIKPDQNLIIAGCYDGSVKILNISSQSEDGRLECDLDRQGSNPVKQVALSDDGKYVCAGFTDGSFVRWNFENPNEKKVLQGKCHKWNQLAISKNADFFITFCEGHQSLLFIDIEPRERKEINVVCLESSHEGIKFGEEYHKKVSFSISQDSKYIISAARSGMIDFFDAQTKQEVPEKSFKLQGNLSCITVTPDNEFLIVLFEDGGLKVFDFEKLGPEPKLHYDFGNIFEDCPRMITVTPNDSRYIIAISKERTYFRMLDLVEKNEIHSLFSKVHEREICCVTVTPDSKFIVFGSPDKSIKLFEIATKEISDPFKEHLQGAVHSVIVTPNNKYVISASDDLSIKIFDLDTKDLVHQFFYSHDDQITVLSMSPENRFLASGSKDCSVRIFDIKTKQLVHHLKNIHNEGLKKIEFAPNHKYLISLSEDGSLKFINFETTLEADEMRRCENLSAVISRNNQLICVTSDLEVKDLRTEEQVIRIEKKVEGEITSMAVSLDNNFLICGTSKGNVGVYSLDDETQFQILNGPSIKTFTAITAIAMTYNNIFIIIGSQDKVFKAIIRETGRVYRTFENIHHSPINISRGPVYSIGVVPNNQSIILSTGDKSLTILDIDKKKIDFLENVHRRKMERSFYTLISTLGTIRCVAVSRDGKFFASCSDDRCIKIFDWETKEVIHWFKDVHKDPFSAITFSQDCRFLITGSLNKSIKVFDIKTRQQLHHFHKIHTSDIKYLTTTPDNRYIVSAFSDNCIKIFKLIPTSPLFPAMANHTENRQKIWDQEIYYVYRGVLNYSNLNAVDTFVFHPQMPIENVFVTAGHCQNLTVYPYQWNILHIVVIKHHHAFLKNMPEYAKLKVPFLLDAFSKTPLHYLMAYTKTDLGYVNTMLNYICDYLDDLGPDQRYQAQEIILSLTPLFWDLLVQPDVKIRARFFGLCSIAPPMPYNTEPPEFGEKRADVHHFYTTLKSVSDSIQGMCEEGEGQINFRVNVFNLDYNVLSADMKITIRCLSRQKNEDIFKTTLIIDLIDYLWYQVEFIETITFLIFSAYIIALSVYLSLDNQSLPYQLVILFCSSLYLLCEVLRGISIKKEYLKDLWNFVDLSFHPLTISYVIVRISGLEDELVIAWISSIIILLGYLRWISNLRIFKPTRNLIEVIITVVKDMWSFVVIIAAIIIGFSFILLVFDRGDLYGVYLYNAYHSLYEPATDEAVTPSELVLIAFIAFLLNVILLNLLISIMSDSYVNVLEKRIKTDSLTRLDLMSEGISILKCLRFIQLQRLFKYPRCNWCKRRLECLEGKRDPNRGFLVRCKSVNLADDDGDKWEGRLSIFRKLFKQSENLYEKEIQKLQQDLHQNLARIEKKRKADEERLEEKLLAELDKMRNEQNKKIDKMLALFAEVNCKLDRQPNNQEHQENETSGKVNQNLKRNVTI